MNKYAQNNFKQSAAAKQSQSNKPMICLSLIVLVAVVFAFKHAIGG